METKNVKVDYETWKTLKRFATENDKTIIDLINSSFEGLEMSDINV